MGVGPLCGSKGFFRGAVCSTVIDELEAVTGNLLSGAKHWGQHHDKWADNIAIYKIKNNCPGK
jgi:hypothetical protein